MKSFSCSDVMKDCNWKATGTSNDEIMTKAAEHGREKHGIMALTEELKTTVMSKIRELKGV